MHYKTPPAIAQTYTFITLDDPKASPSSTEAFGINNAGQVTGWYVDSTGAHSFIATPVAAPKPSP